MTLKLVMMGTGDFAVPTFRALYDTPHTVLALFTQPDRMRTGQERHANAMKDVAIARNTPVFQPEKINTPESLGPLRELGADLFVVAAYGQILSNALLQIPRLGAINVHASLLPKYRGAAPVNYAIWKGETETGVSIIELERKLDAGPILAMSKTSISPGETAGELEERLGAMGARLTADVLDQLDRGTVTRLIQDEACVSFAPKLMKEQGAIDWSRTADELDWHIRAMQPWPTPYTFLHQPGKKPQRFIVRKVQPSPSGPASKPGVVLEVQHGRLRVGTGSAPVEILDIQPQGKRTMTAAEFLRGARLAVGDRFGPEASSAPMALS